MADGSRSKAATAHGVVIVVDAIVVVPVRLKRDRLAGNVDEKKGAGRSGIAGATRMPRVYLPHAIDLDGTVKDQSRILALIGAVVLLIGLAAAFWISTTR